MSNFQQGSVRQCGTTGLNVCLDAQKFIKLHAVCAVVFLLLGALAAIGLALTRWSSIHLLDDIYYYRFLTFHGVNMLIFWILSLEVPILYFTATSLLNSRLFSNAMGWICFFMMAIGTVMVDYCIVIGKADVLMTSYAPLKADPMFYLGIIIAAVGTLIGVLNFFGTVYIAQRDKTFNGSMPLVVYGALAAAIIAFFTLIHGALILVPTWMWSMGWIANIDAGVYRLIWWALGHSSQQVNVCAMVAVWYFLATLTVGARPLNESVCRSAFLFYILFISIASAHHLLVDPGVGAAWKIWNTSYAMYLAVLASMIHGFTVPASVEVAMRKRGHDRGLFQWLANAPWKDPGFSAFFLSLVIFGFGGGITGVTLGTQQINIIAHNTLRIPGHFHLTVAGGTTLAFMGLCYYVIPLIWKADFNFPKMCRITPYVFGAGISLMGIGMSFAGSYGVPRRHWDMSLTRAPFAADFAPAHFWTAVLGIGGLLAATGAIMFCLSAVEGVFLGKAQVNGRMAPWQGPEEQAQIGEMLKPEYQLAPADHKNPGTMVLVLILLVAFAVYYFANWKALADVWHVR